MNQFANALGKKFLENQEMLRVRSFEMNGHTFKVKVPTTLEYEAINENIKIADDELVEKYYQELSKPFIDKKEEFKKESDIQYKDNFEHRPPAYNPSHHYFLNGLSRKKPDRVDLQSVSICHAP